MLHSILMPTWLHFASQSRSKIHENVDPKRVPIMHPFSLRFWTPKTFLLGPNLEPSWPSVSLQDGPRNLPDPPQDGSQIHLGAILALKFLSRRSKKPPGPPPGPPQGRSRRPPRRQKEAPGHHPSDLPKLSSSKLLSIQ